MTRKNFDFRAYLAWRWAIYTTITSVIVVVGWFM